MVIIWPLILNEKAVSKLYFKTLSKEFEGRYSIFHDVSHGDQYPGKVIDPVDVDVMFQIVVINERKMIAIILI